MESKPIKVAALGRPLFPGMLYDCHTDSFIPGVTLWDKESLTGDLDSRPQLMTDLKFSSSDSLSSKANLMDISASLKLSFFGGLVDVGGSAKYLRDTKSSHKQSRVTMYYSETSRFDQLTMTQLSQITYPQVFDQKTATHVVTAVLYGAQAFMVFDQMSSEDENKQDIEGKLNVMVKKIPCFSIEGEGSVKLTDEEKKTAENITCTFHGDFHLEQNPTTYMEALDLYKKLPTLLTKNPQNAVPIKVWLYPLHLLDTKAAQLVREISTSLVSNTEGIMEELGDVERTFNDLSKRKEGTVFSDIEGRLHSFQDSFSIYKTVLQKAVANVLPDIRGGKKDEQSLADILKIHDSSPFKADKLNHWLNDAKSELNLLSSQTEMLEQIRIEDSDGLNTILLDPDIDTVVCLTFTSLKYEDPYLSTLKEFLKSDEFKKLDGNKNVLQEASTRKWFNVSGVIKKMRENLSIFRDFSEANKDEDRIDFIISAVSETSNQGSAVSETSNQGSSVSETSNQGSSVSETSNQGSSVSETSNQGSAVSETSNQGSSIYLYEKGNLTDTKFQPVSKPPPPIVNDVQEHSVSLKLQESPSGETEKKYRVEYKQVKAEEEEWLFINTEDEDFTLTGLESGKKYLIRYRIVGKVGVSEASDTVRNVPFLGPDVIVGGKGGSEFSFKPFSRNILKINITHSEGALNSIQVILAGQMVEVGSVTGSKKTTFEFDKNDKIVAATLWPNINHTRCGGVEFKLLNGEKKTAKCDRLGEPVSLDVKSGRCCGIMGRCGSEIDALGLCFI